MKIKLIYHLRLGDILRSLPLAEKLNDQGHEVWFECLPQYHEIFDCVDYCRPVSPGVGDTFDRVIDLQVWPNRYDEYRASNIYWAEFVLGPYMVIDPNFDPIPKLNVVEPSKDYFLPEKFCLVSPFGISAGSVSTIHIDGKSPVYVLAMPDQCKGPRVISAAHLKDLVWLIANAEAFSTVNSSPSVIAAAVRSSYRHVKNSNPAIDQDDFRCAKQIRPR